MLSHTSSSQSKNTSPLFLVGFMGCGKTTLGRKLANRLGYEFIDLDDVLEAHAGMTIADYFSEYGEAKFRELESEILKQTPYPPNAIVSTGGGLPCFFDHTEWMNSHGRSLYVKLSPKTLADRLEHGKAHRPLLSEKYGDDLINFIAEKLAEREVFYNQATFVADGINLTAEKVEELIAG